MGRRRAGVLPQVRVTDHGGRKYARLRVGRTTHHLGRVYGDLSADQVAKATALIRDGSAWCVYVIGDGHGNFKIGVTQEINERLRQLQTGNASLLVAVYLRHFASEADARCCESHCHAALHLRSIHGEWFRCSSWDAIDLVSGFSHNAEALA